MGWMWLLWVVVIVIVVWVVVRLAGSRSAHGDSPEEILKKRYARGEIDREEYEKLLGDLRR